MFRFERAWRQRPPSSPTGSRVAWHRRRRMCDEAASGRRQGASGGDVRLGRRGGTSSGSAVGCRGVSGSAGPARRSRRALASVCTDRRRAGGPRGPGRGVPSPARDSRPSTLPTHRRAPWPAPMSVGWKPASARIGGGGAGRGAQVGDLRLHSRERPPQAAGTRASCSPATAPGPLTLAGDACAMRGPIARAGAGEGGGRSHTNTAG